MRRTLAIAAVLCFMMPVHSQTKDEKKGTWNGEFSMAAGSNFTKPLKEDVGEHYSKYFSRTSGEAFAKLGWSGKKFSLDGKLEATSFVYLTGGFGVTAEGDKDFQDIADIKKAYGDVSIKETNASAYRGSLSGKWEINPENKLEFYYQFGFMKDIPKKGVVTYDDLIDTVARYQYGYTSEDINESKYVHSGGLNYLHSFAKPGRTFKATVDVFAQKDDKYTEWNLGDGDLEKSVVTKIYRETPLYYDNSLVSQLKYTDLNFLNVKLLRLEFLFDFKFKADLDRLSAANYINNVWVDSTSYRENFDFFSFTPRPGVRVEYTRGIFNVNAKYQPEWYSYKLSGDNIFGHRMKGAVAHFVDFDCSIIPGKNHKISYKFSRDMSRPDYIQICWFDRAGSYANEIIRGNPDLKPSTSTKSSLVYDFKYNRFRTSLDLDYKYEFNKIESTFTTEEWPDGNIYRIKTWINSSKSATADASLTLGWEGKDLKAEIGGKYTYYVGWKDSGSETRDSDYSLHGEVTYNLKSWKFNANLKYQSAIIRNYTSITDILGCDVRIDKNFKHFGIFLEGRDLFDKAIEKFTISDDETQKRLEMTNDNRRIYLLGLTYSF